ncbi:MAG: DUF2336 domain-containing protein [Rhodospirillales bacterium]|nr:DUF2336 domain-containing protein [Rhodospirillales bacterium]
MFKGLIGKILGKGALDLEEAKRLARHKDVKVRLKLAQREDLPQELLYFLAEDKSADVRRAIAKNIATPKLANLLLSRDSDDEVRYGLAEKIGRLMPGLSPAELDRMHEVIHQVLEQLTRDQAVRVRRILSETLKDIANAPPDVIKRLARDVELVVCAPVLEYSPVLTDDDLRDIISSAPVKGAMSAISNRRGLSESVADAIFDADDEDAIGVMLGNKSAQIREATLDRIVDRAEDVTAWHAPLAERPKLSRKAVLRLAEFVAENVMDTLKNRTDFDAETVEAVHEEFSRRMEAAERTRARDEGGPPGERAKKLFKRNELTDTVIREAAQVGDEEFVVTALALKADMKLSVIKKVFDISSVKGVVALCWKAGLSMPTAVVVQKRLARIPPREVLGSIDGDYPFNEKEMQWQLEFIRDSL